MKKKMLMISAFAIATALTITPVMAAPQASSNASPIKKESVIKPDVATPAFNFSIGAATSGSTPSYIANDSQFTVTTSSSGNVTIKVDQYPTSGVNENVTVGYRLMNTINGAMTTEYKTYTRTYPGYPISIPFTSIVPGTYKVVITNYSTTSITGDGNVYY